MIKVNKGNLCNNCIKDKWQNTDTKFNEIYIGTEQNGLRMHLCEECLNELIAQLMVVSAKNEQARQHGQRIKKGKEWKKNGNQNDN